MIDNEFIALQEALAGEYSLERELGRGGMGVVYLARDVQLDRLVAIKVLPGTLADRPEIRERFLREARTAASLSHPNIVPIHRVGERGGFVFFVMAYVHGETLGERLRTRGPLTPTAATRLLRDVAWALAYAHGRGIIHRDVKPDNILIEAETERALVSDFGIALGRGASDDEPGRVLGTARFMSPEQAAGEPLDGRSDLYSLGIVAHLTLTGHLPADASALVSAHGAPETMTALTPAVSPSLSSAIARCLRAAREDRWSSGEALADALERSMSPNRARLPMPLRVWVTASDPFKPLYIIWSGAFVMGTLSELRRGGDWPVTLSFALVPLVPLGLFHARKTYQALAAGYGLSDLRRAVRTWQMERREEIAFDQGEHEPAWKRGLRMTTLASLGVLGAGIWVAEFRPLYFFTRSIAIALVSTAFASVVAVATSNSLGVSYLPRRLRGALVGAVRSTIWGSRVGQWLAKLLTPRHRRAIADAESRPTEMALGVAAEDLYAALPKAFREHLSDLPKVVRGLEAHAAAARARIDEIGALSALGQPRGAMDGAPPSTELSAAGESARRELAAAVAALEAIRLDLLRLHGRGIDADVAPMTTSLQAARRLSDDLDELTRARREVDGIAPAFGITPATPV